MESWRISKESIPNSGTGNKEMMTWQDEIKKVDVIDYE